MVSPSCGSSPLVRGGPTRATGAGPARGLIPARAGRTDRRSLSRWKCRAHPRSCGADTRRFQSTAGLHGSSPLVRGGRCEGLREGPARRLIPARAGRTVRRAVASTLRSAHPRSCGADSAEAVGLSRNEGSSPLVRGGRRSVSRRPKAGRLIPARAGRTSWSTSRADRKSAHPRSCGADTCLPGETPGVSPRLVHFRCARRHLAALLHPGRGPVSRDPSAVGRRTRVKPSTSTTSQSCRCARNSSLCSLRIE